jgi:hypothetical protein
MSKFSQSSHRRSTRSLLEALEERRLMATGWGQQEIQIGQDAAAINYPTVTGTGQSIAIIDTGVDYNSADLGGGFGPGHKVVAGYDFVDNDNDPMDTDGHGTGVASLAAGLQYTFNGAKYQGVAPGANIIALRIDDGTFGWAKEAPLAELALQWVIAHRAQYNIVAVNMSFGRGHYQAEATQAPFSDELQTLADQGVFLAASSGNDGLQNGVPGIEYPGADPNVFAIGAVYPDGSLWSSTERGPHMDLLAPGADITLPYYLPASNEAIHLSGGYGTSFSTAFASGMAAVLRQLDSTLTPDEMMSLMQRGGSPLFDPTTNLTWSRLNMNGALTLAYKERDDARENNDSTGAATALSFSGDTASINNLKLLQADADFFKFTLAAQADVDYALSQSGTSFTPAVDLLDSNGTVIKRLSSTDSLRMLPGTYFLRVNAPASTMSGTYGLSITQTPDDGLDNNTPQTAAPIALNGSGQGSISGMTLLGGVDDYYSFTIDSTHDVNLSIPYGGTVAAPTVQLLDTNGNFIATIGSALSRRLSAGRYLIKVSSPDTLDATYGVNVGATVVVTPGQNGLSNGIAYDAAGNLYLAYYDGVSNNLKFAKRTAAGVWGSAVVVDGGNQAGQFVSLTLDASGLPGIAYYDANNADLKYAHFNGSTWDVMTVDSTFTTGYYPSLQYDSLSRPVISYYSKTSADLKFAAYFSGKWNLSTIDSAGDVGRYSSLALNPLTGRWGVAYEDTAHGTFKYADQGKSGWSLAMVDRSTQIGGGYISLAFNPVTKLPAFSYYDAYNANLKYATFNGSVWSNTTIASKGSVGLYTSLLFDSTGKADILYYNKGSDSVFQARPSAGIWSLTQITSDGGRWISRAVAGGHETYAYVRGSTIGVADL